ncbi:MAG: Gfo/Idh/MocA family oxidoreductase [Phycisphaerae bacterium]|nr:Gfo/Idh/MocA family oxidoreductase [Phycisphaerae bacterium]
MKPVKLLVIGGGSRGKRYASYAQDYPDRAKVVGIAEPRESHRKSMIETYDIPEENVFADWRQAAQRDLFADAVIIATLDDMHVEPAVAFADKGYHMLLEKPMAPSEAGCRQIVEAAIKNKILFAVCHVMRYTPYTLKLKSLLDSGAIGEIISIQHLEPLGHCLYVTAYVRGRWRNEAESSPMLLAKACHDLDWIRDIMGVKCLKVSSFGSLCHFRKKNQPAGAADRCADCSVEMTCPFSAQKIYMGQPPVVRTEHLIDAPTGDMEKDGPEILRSRYGRCVYACDNDVVDNQVVNMEFEGGKTASFTMTGFSEQTGRRTTIFGTRGELYCNVSNITVFDFLTGSKKVIDASPGTDIHYGHAGGDAGLMESFIAAVGENDPSKIPSGPEESLESHLMVFAAEKARHENTVVEI